MEALWQAEIGIIIWLQSLGSWLQAPMQVISFLANQYFFLAVMPALYWCVDAGYGLRLGVMLVLSYSVNIWLKLLAQFPRPYWLDRAVLGMADEPDFGMPSGHSQSATGIWGLAAFKARHLKWLTWLTIAVIVLVGISRMYLGVHFLSEVLVGWLMGALLIWALTRLEEPLLRRLRGMRLGQILAWVVATSLMMVAITWLVLLTARPVPAAWSANAAAAVPGSEIAPFNPDNPILLAGLWLGLAGGAAWLWKRWGLAPTGGSWQRRVVRYALGIAVVGVVWYGLGTVFPRSADLLGYGLRYLRYALVGFWVSGLAPLVFRRLRLV